MKALTVEELVEKLLLLPQHLPVCFESESGCARVHELEIVQVDFDGAGEQSAVELQSWE